MTTTTRRELADADEGIEYAMKKRPDGTPVVRGEAWASLQRWRATHGRAGPGAVASRPGARSTDPLLDQLARLGERLDAAAIELSRPRRRTLAECEARQRFVEMQLRQERVNANVRPPEDERLIFAATEMQWRWAKQFAAGTAFPSNPSRDQRVGWVLARRGYTHPPLRVKSRWLEGVRREIADAEYDEFIADEEGLA